MPEAHEVLTERLTSLGFSQYEARAYVGLLQHGEQTGYALANATGVPQPKVYETLHRLLERGAAVQTSEHPARYAAVPSAELLGSLEREFSERLRGAREELSRIATPVADEPRGQARRFASRDQLLARATACIEAAEHKVYMSGGSEELEPLAGAVRAALDRGVEVIAIHFGPLPFSVPRGRSFRHASTEGTLYPSHRARHLAVVADAQGVVWGLARDGQAWRGLAGNDDLLASAVRAFIRHDIMIQRIYADMPEPLTALYGPGLLELGDMTSEPPDEPGDLSPTAAERAG